MFSRRFIDELRGAMLRTGAGQGLLVTTSKFSNVAPIKLIEGEEVLEFLFAYRIGAVERQGVWQLDGKYLDMIQKGAMGT